METPVQNAPEEALESVAPPAPILDQQKLEMYMHRLSMDQNLVKGIIAGSLAAVAGAVVWAVVTVITGYQIGYLAVAIGFAVGYMMRIMGRGIDKVFGVMGALLALFGCALGNFLSTCGFVANEYDLGYLEVLQTLDYSFVPELL